MQLLGVAERIMQFEGAILTKAAFYLPGGI